MQQAEYDIKMIVRTPTHTPEDNTWYQGILTVINALT